MDGFVGGSLEGFGGFAQGRASGEDFVDEDDRGILDSLPWFEVEGLAQVLLALGFGEGCLGDSGLTRMRWLLIWG